MRRRDFITLLGGAAAAWPLAARAQQANRMRRLGVLTSFAASDPEVNAWLRAFQEKLHNIQIEYRLAGTSDQQRLRTDAPELVGMAPDVLFAPPPRRSSPSLGRPPPSPPPPS